MAAAYHQISGLDTLHSGLCSLRKSKMMSAPEFKNMFWAMERHHSDLKLAHLTGKAKDLQVHAIRDTKFYNILVKMLCELKDKRNIEQRSGLQKVYLWYTTNKHALYCGPHFGRELLKEKAQKVLRKAATQRNPPMRSKSAKARSDRSIPNNTPRVGTAYGVAIHNLEQDYKIQHDYLPGVEMNDLEPQFAMDEDYILRDDLRKLDDDHHYDDEENRTESVAATPNVLLRPKTASSVTFSPFKEQSINCPEKVISLKQGSVHSISSLVNPHTALANELAPKEIEDIKSLPPAMKIHLQNSSSSRETLHSKPSRQGGRPQSGIQRAIHINENEENAFVQQTLEEFYEIADTIVPSPRLVYTPRMVPKMRAKSAPMRRDDNTRKISLPSSAKQKRYPQKSDSQTSQENNSKQVDTPPPAPVPSTGVKLDTVIYVIDSVTGEMPNFNEKLMTDERTGIKQPSAVVEVMDSVVEGRDSVIIDTSTFVSKDGDMTPPDNTPRPFLSPISPRKDSQSPDRRRSKMRCSSASSVDWRGRIQPDTMRYKWSKTPFGGHTYLKKWPQRNLRSAGSTSGGKRPKTAPITAKEKWKTQKTMNPKAVGAATHNTVVVNQEDVDTMITVQHLLSGNDRAGSFGSLDSLDEDFWRKFQKESHPLVSTTPTMEFLSFITPPLTSGLDQSKELEVFQTELQEDIDEGGSLHGDFDEQERSKICIDLPSYNEEALDAAVTEELQDSEEPDSQIYHSPSPDEKNEKDKSITPKDIAEPHVEITAFTPEGKSPQHQRYLPLQELSPSDPWQFSLDEELWKHSRKGNHFCDVQLGIESRDTDNMTTRVERSAGRMPSQTHSTSVQMLAFSRRYSEALRRAPPLRTPPSIPTPQTSAKKPNKRGRGQIFLELEHQARRTRSPRNFLRKVQSYRSIDSSRTETAVSQMSNDTVVGTSLHVCKLPVSSRERSSLISTEYDFDSHASFFKNWDQTPYMSREPTSLQSIHENNGGIPFDRQVSFHNYSRGGVSSKPPMTAPASGMQPNFGSFGYSEDLRLQRNATFTSIGSKRTAPTDIPPSRSIARIGRPIAQVSHIPDPDDLVKAVQVQKEAAAAVDIQRIFRGYVARTIYKSLLTEERQKVEDQQQAAIRIQSLYRGHLSRKHNIYNRPPLNPELVSWGKDVSKIQAAHASRRNFKKENLSNEMASNQRDANSKMSVIGPHVEIYDIYHPKRTGPSKRELALAATKLQKVVRGWMVRRKMEKLARKATWYGSNFPKMVNEYKTIVKRVQRQHGVDKAKTPFSIKEMSDYIDTKRRYESVFEKKAFGGELECNDIEAFFKECDLYPSQAEIDEAMDVTMHGKANRKENQGLKKKELMDMIFYIYVPPATGLEGTRQSTWMNPIINGKEARKLIGSEFVEAAPLDICAKLVVQTKKEQRLKKQAKEQEGKKILEEKRVSTSSSSESEK